MRLHDTHAYPGCRASLPEEVPGDGDVLVQFSDGAETPGRLRPAEARLDIAAHVTARGTCIAARSWRLARDGAGWKIAARLPGPG